MRLSALTVLFVVCAMITGCKTALPSERGGHLKLMTYNIRIGKGGGEWNNDPTKVDLEPVAKVIQAFAPDLVGLQEVDRHRKRTSLMDQPQKLSERLNLKMAFQPAYTVNVPDGKNEEYGNALLTGFPIRKSERIALFKPDYSRSHPNYPDYYSEQRGVLHAEVEVHGKLVHVFVTHLGLTADQRDKQIRQIIAEAEKQHGPVIIMGDFNAAPSEPAMQLLAQRYTDVLSAVNTAAEDRKSYPGGLQPKELIDYIFVSKHFEVVKAQVIRDVSLASDHNPVVADVRLRK